MVTFRGCFWKFRRASPSGKYGSLPPGEICLPCRMHTLYVKAIWKTCYNRYKYCSLNRLQRYAHKNVYNWHYSTASALMPAVGRLYLSAKPLPPGEITLTKLTPPWPGGGDGRFVWLVHLVQRADRKKTSFFWILQKLEEKRSKLTEIYLILQQNLATGKTNYL